MLTHENAIPIAGQQHYLYEWLHRGVKGIMTLE